MVVSRKGQIGDIAFVLVTLLSIACTFIVAGYVYTEVGDGLESSGLETNESEAAYDQVGVAFPIFDKSFVFIVVALTILLLVSSFFIPTHPIFLIINIFGFLVLVFLGAVLSNLYSDFIVQPGINASALAYYPITTFVMGKLPWIGAVLVLVSSIIMYAKGREV